MDTRRRRASAQGSGGDGREAVAGDRGPRPAPDARAVLAAVEEEAEAGSEDGSLERGGGPSAAAVQGPILQLGGGGEAHRGPHAEAVSRAVVQPRGSSHPEGVSAWERREG